MQQQTPLIAALIIFSVAALLLVALIVLKTVNRRRLASHRRRRKDYLHLLSRHLAYENCTDPITAPMAEDPAFFDALIDMRNAVTGDGISTLHRIVNQNGVIDRQIKRLDSRFSLGRRLRAAVSLAELGDESAVDALMRHLDDPQPEIRIQCARGLGRIQWTPAIEEIVWRFHFETPWVRARFSDTLTGFGTKATWPLLAYIRVNHRHDTNGPALALRTIAQIQDHQAVGPVLEILRETPNMESEIAAIETLGELGSPEALPVLLERLDATSWEVRTKSASALGGIGDPKATPRLRKAMRDESWWVRRAAAAAIAKLPGGIAELYAALDDHDPYAADAAAEALADAGELITAREKVINGDAKSDPLLTHMSVEV
ncbi:MAG: HEAT repeat domain-containing protein [Actinomycetota bacterium]